MPEQTPAAPQPATKAAQEQKTASLINLLHIALDNYDDIFSDFDPSAYERRVLSEDFLKEVQRRYAETKTGDIEIRFSIPAAVRSIKVESTIKKRLKEYFHAQKKEIDSEVSKRKVTGAIYFAVGFFVLGLTATAAEMFPNSRSVDVTSILLTPIGWFGMWEGVVQLVQVPQKFADQRKFFSKFSKANYIFMDEQEYVQQLARSMQEEAKAEEQKK